MKIWNGNVTKEICNELNKDTLGAHLEINFTEVGDDYIKATMPVNNKTKQPFGLLHGGASVALAETIGSVASWCVVNREFFVGLGVEINASHIKSVTEGIVTAICRPLKITGKTHVWDIKIYNQSDEVFCACRFTAMIVPRKNIKSEV